MHIEAHTTYGLRVYQGLSRQELFQRRNPVKCLVISSAIYVLLFAGLIALGILYKHGDNFKVLIALPLIALIYNLYMFFVSPYIKYKSADKLSDLKNTFIFTEEEIQMISESSGYKGKGSFAYKSLYRVCETDEFIFIYQDKTKVYVVDKSEVDDSDEEIIREHLRKTIGKRYIRCKY